MRNGWKSKTTINVIMRHLLKSLFKLFGIFRCRRHERQNKEQDEEWESGR